MHLIKRDLNFFPLGKAFSTGLDKTVPNYQEKGVIKLLKDIRDSLAGGIVPRRPDDNDEMMIMMRMMRMMRMIGMMRIMTMMRMMIMMRMICLI